MISSEASLQTGSGTLFYRWTFISMECDLIHALRFFSVAHMGWIYASFDNRLKTGQDVNQRKYWNQLF